MNHRWRKDRRARQRVHRNIEKYNAQVALLAERQRRAQFSVENEPRIREGQLWFDRALRDLAVVL